MKRSFIKSLLALMAGVLFCITLASCENFLSGSNAKDELKRYIDYANAPKITVKIRLDSSDYGTIYPPTAKVAKGDTFTVEFTQKKVTVFRYWTFTNPNTGEDLDETYFTVLKETVEENDIENTVTRSLQIVMNALPPDMEIRPKCYLITEATPPEFTRLNVANFEQDAVAGTNLINIIDDPAHPEYDTFDYYAKSVNYNGDSNTVAANIHNHHVSALWINLEAYDINSGVDSIEIQETLIYTKDTSVVTNRKTYTTNYDLTPEVWQPSIEQLFKHDFKTKFDGVVRVKITLYDKSGNSVSKQTDVIKDNNCDPYWSVYAPTVDTQIAGDDNLHLEYIRYGYVQCSDTYYIKDLDGHEYRDCDSMVYPLYTSLTDYSYLLSDIKGKIDKYVVLDYKYEGGEYTNYPIQQFFIDDDYNNVGSDKRVYPFGSIGCFLSNEAQGACDRITMMLFVYADDYRDLSVRIRSHDDVGNEQESVFVFPKSAWLTHVELENHNVCFFWDPKMGLTAPYVEYFDVNHVKQNYRSYWGSILYPTGHVYENDGFFYNNDGSLKTGYFYCYLIKPSDPRNGAWIKARAVKPYIIYSGVEPPADMVPLDSCDIPDFTCTVAPIVKNIGTRTVNINITQPFTPVPGVSYIIKCSGGDGAAFFKEITDFTGTTSLEVATSNSNNPYHINIMLMNSSKAEPRIDDSKEKTETLNEDNYAPSIAVDQGTYYQTLLFPDRRIIFLEKNKDTDPPRQFDNKGLKTDPNKPDNILIKYMYSDMYDLIERGINWDDKQFVREYSQPASNQTLTPPRIELPYDGTNGEYCYVLLEDNNGNSTVQRFDHETLHKQVPVEDDFNTVPKVTVTSENDPWHNRNYLQLEWLQNCDYLNWNVTSWYVDQNNSDDHEWKLINQIRQYTNNIYNTKYWLTETASYFQGNDYSTTHKWDYKPKMWFRGDIGSSYDQCWYKYDLDAQEATTTGNEYYSFIKSYIWASQNNRKNGGYFDVIYFYPRYIYQPNTFKCNKRIFIPGANGFYGETDIPCLVHTFYSSVDLGSIQNWLNQGIEVDVHQYGWMNAPASFTYTQPLTKIPQGKYYTTIIHYADGSMENSAVKMR